MGMDHEIDPLIYAIANSGVWPDLRGRSIVRVYEPVDIRLTPIKIGISGIESLTGKPSRMVVVLRIDLPEKDSQRPQSLLAEIDADKFLRAAEEIRFGDALVATPDHLEPRGSARLGAGPPDRLIDCGEEEEDSRPRDF